MTGLRALLAIASVCDCIDLVVGGWDCMAPEEIKTIVKGAPFVGGGVLCCRMEPSD